MTFPSNPRPEDPHELRNGPGQPLERGPLENACTVCGRPFTKTIRTLIVEQVNLFGEWDRICSLCIRRLEEHSERSLKEASTILPVCNST